MQLGWIDFSRNERDKVINLLSLLEESGILDELGIAPVRDAFSDLFFPGTSTIQTIPKYFFIAAYILKDFERGNETSYTKALASIKTAEHEFCKRFRKEDGVIGKRVCDKEDWLKRTPMDIYWAGMRKYGIITGGVKLSIREYVRSICNGRKMKNMCVAVRAKESDGYADVTDDADAGRETKMMHINMPVYKENWMNDSLKIKLTREEGAFLKSQIIENCPGTMLSYVLENNVKEFCEADNFYVLEGIAEKYDFPCEMKRKIAQAISFSEFVYITRIAYNMVVCPYGEGDEEFKAHKDSIKEIAEAFDTDKVMCELGVKAPSLRNFLVEARECMLNEDIERLKDVVTRREISIKSSARARCAHPKEYEYQWYGGGRLDYRFSTAKRIARDIFDSEV